MSTAQLETGISSLQFSRRMACAFLDAIPEADWLHIPVPGGNHALWTAGHLAWEDDDILTSLVEGRGSKLESAWKAPFAQGSRPVEDAGRYPEISAIRHAMETFRQELLAFFAASVDRLNDPLPKGFHAFAPNLASLMPALACHEMIHVGQLTVVRKSLQLPPVFG